MSTSAATPHTPDPLRDDPGRGDELILVDPWDLPVGTASKEVAHQEGLLHRAFSVVLTRTRLGRTEVLLARRAGGKYHAAGLWANSCCSHPRDGESILVAAHRRVREELGCGMGSDVREIGSFVYRAAFSNGLVEYEFDHVLLATPTSALTPRLSEVDATWWVDADKLGQLLRTQPGIFAPWAITVLPLALAHLR